MSNSRQQMVEFYKKLFAEYWADKSRKPYHQGLDTTELQIASVDEMMAAYGYVPRRVASHPDVRDGRFGYTLAFPIKDSRAKFLSLEDAVSMHNGVISSAFSTTMQRKLSHYISKAREYRIVEIVSVQRIKGGGLKSQTQSVKFLEEE